MQARSDEITTIGFLGAGTVAQTIARHILPHVHRVILSNTRGPEPLSKIVADLGPGASAGSAQEATDQDVVILAVGWQSVQTALSVIPDWKGRVLLDATNRLVGKSPSVLGDISGRTSSEIVADLAAGAYVVKAFSSVPMTWISDFTPSKERTVLFISGDDDDAKGRIADLIEKSGLKCIDLGSLASGGRLQQLGGPLSGIRLAFQEKLAIG